MNTTSLRYKSCSIFDEGSTENRSVVVDVIKRANAASFGEEKIGCPESNFFEKGMRDCQIERSGET